MSRRTLLAGVREGTVYLLRRPLRSALTAATCAVAIAVTVNVISLSYGMDADIRADIGRFGRLTVDVGRTPLIRPGTPRPAFGPAERDRIASLLADLRPTLVPMKQASAEGKGDVVVPRMSLVAVPADYPRTLSVPVVAGRFLSTGDRGFDACVLDAGAAAELWPGVPPSAVVGKTLDLGPSPGPAGSPRRTPTVVGVRAAPLTFRARVGAFAEGRAARAPASSLLTFKNAYVPFDAIPGDDLTRVSIVLPDEPAVGEAARRLRKVWGEDLLRPIMVFVRKEWMESLGASSQYGAMLGNVIWIIIVFVAAIMISTLNLITIRERYDELAIRRCEGARKRDVAVQVTTEGVLTALVGGIAGLPLGYLGAALLRRIVEFPFRFEARYALVATAVAAGLGLVSAVLPARRAAGLDPARVLTRRLT